MNDSSLISPKPKRVCFPFVGDTVGGSHIDALLHIQNLDPARYEPVILLHEKGKLADYLTQLNIPYEILPLTGFLGTVRGIFRNGMLLLKNGWKLRNFLCQNRISIVHTYDARMHYTWAVPTSLAGCRMMWDQQGQWSDSRLCRLMVRFAHQITCISDFVMEDCPPVREEKVSILRPPFITDGLDLSRNDARTALLNRISTDLHQPRIVGFCSNFSERKHPLSFVRIAAEIVRRHSDPVVFIMAGDDRNGMAERVKNLSEELGIADRLYWLGFASPIDPILAGYDILIAPAVDEPFGRTLVEAMIVGTPVVAARSGGHREIIDNQRTGVLVDPDDPLAFSNAVCDLLESPNAMQQLADRSLQHAKVVYSAGKHARAVMEIYDRCFES